jgi:hypothetical protein
LRFTNRELLHTKQLQKEEEKQKKECILLIAWFKDEVRRGVGRRIRLYGQCLITPVVMF